MVKEIEAWYKKLWALSLFVLILVIAGCSSPDSSNDNLQPQQVEPEITLTAQQVLDARQNYKVVVNDWESTGWESHYNPNTEKTMSSFWTKLDLSITNNNPEFSLDCLTIRVNIKHPPGSDGIDTSWGRLTIDVNDIRSGESK